MVSKPYVDIRNRNTQTASVAYAVPSGNVYTIVATTIEDHDEDEYVTLPETIENDVCGPQAGTAAQQASEERKSLPSKITSRRGKTHSQQCFHVCVCGIKKRTN